MIVEEEHAGLQGGPTTSPTPGSPRWRQSREENRKWETAAAEETGAGMEDQMEGLKAAGTRKDGLIWKPFQTPFYQLPLPEPQNPHTTRTPTRV